MLFAIAISLLPTQHPFPSAGACPLTDSPVRSAAKEEMANQVRSPARIRRPRGRPGPYPALGFAAQRITIWHKIQQRKIVGNAAPMAKNLQQYLDKHTDCEVYKGQDRPDELSWTRSSWRCRTIKPRCSSVRPGATLSAGLQLRV